MLSILCPVTSRGCPGGVEDQPLTKALLPSLYSFEMKAVLWMGYDLDDPLWSQRIDRDRVWTGMPIMWLGLDGLQRNITAIWNSLAHHADGDYLLPANDDLAFDSDPTLAIDALAERNNFGLVAFDDSAFPGLPTFFIVHCTHLEIFGGVLYPVPWTGAHQDSWIADVYRPWGASEIDPRIRCRNHVGTGTRFEYGGLEGYRDAVIRGRRTVNNWLGAHPVAERLCDDVLMHTPMIVGETCLSL